MGPPADHRDPGASSPPEGVDGVTVETGTAGPTVTLHAGLESRDLSREEARELRDALSDALTDRSEFVHTAGEHRADGAYVVERRNASSAGHRKVFDSFAECRRRFESLPREFTAEDCSGSEVSGGRRHMLAWHFAEHPAFDCELVSRQPLTVEKRGDPAAD